MGYYYLEGIGVEQDKEKAVFYFMRAVRKQNETAAFNLGECYKKGNGVGKNLKESLRWYRLAKRWIISLDYDEIEKEIKELKEMINKLDKFKEEK